MVFEKETIHARNDEKSLGLMVRLEISFLNILLLIGCVLCLTINSQNIL